MRSLLAFAVLAAASGSVQAQIQQPSSPSDAIWDQHKVLNCTIKGEERPLQIDLERKSVCMIGNSGACRQNWPYSTMTKTSDGGIEITFRIVDGDTRVDAVVYVSKTGDVFRLRANKVGGQESRLSEGSCKTAS